MRHAARFVFCVASLAGCRGTEPPRADAQIVDKVGVPPAAASTSAVDGAVVLADAAGPPAALSCIVEHYVGRTAQRDAEWWIELPDGTSVRYDDGRKKTTAQRIESPDIEDAFALGYPSGVIVAVTDAEQDPGRVRVEPIFRATYGRTAPDVSAALVDVKLAGHTVRFHRRAAGALGRVAVRIEELLRLDPALARFFRELGGTFATRSIAGTDRASAHTWGIAIDIDTSMSDYWRNAPGQTRWNNRIPQSIVDAFESEGFVWGGRWFHYDTMHFEYRPELFGRCAHLR